MSITPLTASAGRTFYALTGRYGVIAIKNSWSAETLKDGDVFEGVSAN